MLFVVVLYTDDLGSCTTIASLGRLAFTRQIHLHFQINGTRDFSSELHELFDADYGRVSCAYDGCNRGIVHAYREAVRIYGGGSEWVTLLDQDSDFDVTWLDTLNAGLSNMQPDDVALVPRIVSSGAQISPFRLSLGRVIPFDSDGGFPVCINSLTTFRAGYLQKLADDFPVSFFLDAFDVWLFHRMHKAGLSFKLLDVTVKHELSLSSGAVSETMLARELMSLINMTRISLTLMPMSLLRFIFRQLKLAARMRSLRPFNLIATYRRYRYLIKDIGAA